MIELTERASLIHLATLIALAPLNPGCGSTGATSDKTWEAQLSVSETGDNGGYASSSRLAVSWTPPSKSVDHYVVLAAESVGSTSIESEAASADTSAVLAELKAGTTYAVSLTACLDENCDSSLAAKENSVEGTTEEEYWQFQGTGDSVSELTRIVSDGNSKLAAMVYGDGAGSSLEGKIQLYYGPLGGSVKGLAVGTLDGTVEDDISSVISFTSLAGSAGLINPSTATSLIDEINTGQGVPLSASLGEKVRLYFEATGSDNKTRILYVDSQDGYVGRDFNAGTGDSVCDTAAEFDTGGACAPTVIIGVEGDSLEPRTGVENARQFKIAIPTLDDWRWDGVIGTFMIFTVETDSSCSSSNRLQGYAVWDGSSWDVGYDDSNTACPKLFENMQAPAPLHLGDVRYKLYYGNPSDRTGVISGSSLPFLGPKQLIYADGESTGDSEKVDFEDWESEDRGRNVHFLWPSGAEMDATDEGYIDDFMALTPTGDLSFQVLYVVITDGSIAPITVASVLLNP